MNPILQGALTVLEETARNRKCQDQIAQFAGICSQALKAGKKILFCGNGGSAAEAQHIAAEFVGRFKKERKGLAAISFTTDTSILTSIANDYSYDRVFARQVEALGEAGDVLFLLSTSGNSKNCLEACREARRAGVTTIGFTGAKGGALKELADHCFCVPSDVTSHIQEVHLVALHALCEMIDESPAG
ncbi:MAG: D-sedoheptulose 7-phosphate isomerase [Candidatus Omnitrophica bacterium]|nr:D-sedoheptulose 7-phosphate isomerase [Candidatus Omnitrophota bacterium]